MSFLHVGQELDFSKIHTKVLLKLLRSTYYNYDFYYELSDSAKEKIIIWDNNLRKELATREHIPNKKESRQLRIARKKSGISRKKYRY